MKRLLIIQTASLGDVILSTSLAESIHFFQEQFEIDFMIKEQFSPAFDRHPYIHNLILVNKNNSKFSEFLKLNRVVRNNHYDIVINIQRFFFTGLMTVCSKAKFKVGFDKNPLSLLFTKVVKHKLNGIHEIERNFQLLDFLKDCKLKHPKLYPGENSFNAIKTFQDDPYICLCPGSLWFTKRFPGNKWIDIIKKLPQSLKIILLGSKDDIQISEEIIKGSSHKNTLNLCGQLEILETAALMKKAQMNYVNDSALLHVASAMEAPVTAVFCSTVPDFGFGPLSNNSSVIETDMKLSCRPCGIHGKSFCPEQHFLCAQSIDIQKFTIKLPV